MNNLFMFYTQIQLYICLCHEQILIDWFKPERMVIIYMHNLLLTLFRETYSRQPNYSKFVQHYNHNSLSYDHSQVTHNLLRRAELWFPFLRNFQPLREDIAKYYCIASSVHNLFDFVHNELHREVNTCAGFINFHMLGTYVRLRYKYLCMIHFLHMWSRMRFSFSSR